MASGGCYILKKILVLSLCVILIAAFTFAACSKKSDDKTTTNSKDTTVQADDLENNNNEYGLETEDVTDKDGKTVTDAKGKAVTTDVAVVYKKDKKGNTYAQKLDKDGKAVTNKKGKPVTVKAETTEKNKTSRVNADTTGSAKTTAKETKPVKVTGTTKKNVPATKSDDKPLLTEWKQCLRPRQRAKKLISRKRISKLSQICLKCRIFILKAMKIQTAFQLILRHILLFGWLNTTAEQQAHIRQVPLF